MPRRFLWIAPALALALVSCAPEVGEFRIGVISYELPVDDPSSHTEGWSTDHATELAVKEINDRGGVTLAGRKVPLRLVHRAINLAPEEAVDAVHDLVNREKVSLILGPSMSTQAIAAGGAAESAQVPLISSVSSNPATTAGRRFVFRMCYTDEVQAEALLGYAQRRAPTGALAVVYDESDPYSSGLARFLEAGMSKGRGHGLVALSPDTEDFRPQLKALAPFGQALILLPTASDLAVKAAVTLRSLGYRGTFLGGDGWSRAQMIKVPEFENSAMATNYLASQDTKGNQAFVVAYKAFAGREPGDTAALTYDSVYLAVQAAESAGSTEPVALRDSIAGLVGFQGVGGSVEFAGSGDPKRSVAFLVFSQGSYHYDSEVRSRP